MIRHRSTYATTLIVLLGACMAMAGAPTRAHDGWHLSLGRNLSNGTAGSQAAVWYVDSEGEVGPASLLLNVPQKLLPNTTGPAEAGPFYMDLPFDVIVRYDPATMRYVDVLRGAVLERVSISEGADIWRGAIRYFAPDGIPTALNNTFRFGLVQGIQYGWHHHLAVRAFRPGTYQFTFRVINAVTREGQALASSETYTLTFENLAVASGQVTLDGWTRIDTSRNLTGNRARVFLFPPHIMPTR
ncbi:MAG: hypothetical protein RMJ43_00840, partial [Chloroherpetonaceae bacterium]|nr:hypothetical protein [Chthonomonadaceae bacterium]MDW8206355.1 hypothetical protein [Chloroherpetonaceae bacterium]